MKMKLFFAAMAVMFTLGVATSCGNKKAATAEEATDKVEACANDSTACCGGDSTKVCCSEDSTKVCSSEEKGKCGKKEADKE